MSIDIDVLGRERLLPREREQSVGQGGTALGGAPGWPEEPREGFGVMNGDGRYFASLAGRPSHGQLEQMPAPTRPSRSNRSPPPSGGLLAGEVRCAQDEGETGIGT